MSLPEVNFCPSTLKNGYTTYSSSALKRLFRGRKVSHILPYQSPLVNEETVQIFEENQKNMSISGFQLKYSLILEKNKLILTPENQQGQYILKPNSLVGKNTTAMPANEHLTMQIAKQVFGLDTAENALIFLGHR